MYMASYFSSRYKCVLGKGPISPIYATLVPIDGFTENQDVFANWMMCGQEHSLALFPCFPGCVLATSSTKILSSVCASSMCDGRKSVIPERGENLWESGGGSKELISKYNRGKHLLIQHRLDATTVVLLKGKEHQPQAASFCSTIQASTRARERVTTSCFPYMRSRPQTKSHTLRLRPQIYRRNEFPQLLKIILLFHPLCLCASVLPCGRRTSPPLLVFRAPELPSAPPIWRFWGESPKCHRRPLLERVPCWRLCEFCVTQ